ATASRRRRSTASCSRLRRPSRSYAGGAVSAPTHRTDRSATAAVEVGEGLLGVITPPALFFAHPAAPPPRRAPCARRRAAPPSALRVRGGGSRRWGRLLPCGRPRAAPALWPASARAPCN